MIYGIGCDLVKVARIKNLYKKFQDSFLKKIYTDDEIANAPDDDDAYTQYLAKRFAAKEAVAKALGTGIGAVIAFNEIEIFKEGSQKPMVRLLRQIDGVGQIHLSISDDHEYAIAQVVIERL